MQTKLKDVILLPKKCWGKWGKWSFLLKCGQNLGKIKCVICLTIMASIRLIYMYARYTVMSTAVTDVLLEISQWHILVCGFLKSVSRFNVSSLVCKLWLPKLWSRMSDQFMCNFWGHSVWTWGVTWGPFSLNIIYGHRSSIWSNYNPLKVLKQKLQCPNIGPSHEHLGNWTIL